MSFEIKPATRESVKPLIGLWGKSGGGKTLSMLLLLRGLVGPKGRIVGIDTENRRMGLYANLIPGGFSTIDLSPPFTPERYWEALQLAEKNADGIGIDSFSHEWAGEGGVLDMHEADLQRMAGNDYAKRESCKMAAWISCKRDHKRLVERIFRIAQPLVVCMRGEEKTHIDKVEGKTKVYTDKFTSPIGDPRFMFEMLVNGECYPKDDDQNRMIGGFLRIDKYSVADILPCLPKVNEQVSIRHGEALAAWCAGGATAKPEKKTDDLGALKKELWTLTKSYHQGSIDKLEQWLHDELYLLDDMHLADLSASKLQSMIKAIKEKTT